jgi:hypothetical protein
MLISRPTTHTPSSHASTATAACWKVDLKNQKGLGHLVLSKMGMPQDIRLSLDGKVFYVADMMNDGVFLIDGDSFSEIGFIATGIGTHGFVVSRDGTKLYVSNRGSHKMQQGRARGRAASPSSISLPTRSSRNGPSPAAAAPTWAMSTRTESDRQVHVIDPGCAGDGFNALHWNGKFGGTKEEDIRATSLT